MVFPKRPASGIGYGPGAATGRPRIPVLVRPYANRGHGASHFPVTPVHLDIAVQPEPHKQPVHMAVPATLTKHETPEPA
ncbi:hypothetical protein GCM10023158_24930 [Gluconacetobacter tumulicola]